jgi:hypothetical protein
VHYFTDPACSASWSAEACLRRLLWEFGDEVRITYVMGGLARSFEGESLLPEWLDAADRSSMPVDPRLWLENPPSSTYPACMAVEAAAEQGPLAEERMLRALREGLLCFRRKLDATEALVETAREAGLDVARFRVDLASNATLEAFGADLELVRSIPDAARAADGVVQGQGGERLVLPTLRAEAADGSARWVFGPRPYDEWRAAVLAADAASRNDPPSIEEALRRFGHMATVEVAAVCSLNGPRAPAELWRLASEWRVRPLRVLTGYLWALVH